MQQQPAERDSVPVLRASHALLESHEFEKTVQLLEKALREHIEPPEVYLLLAEAQKSLGRLQDAELSLQTGILTHPRDTQLHLALARVYRDLGDYPDAIEVLMDVVSYTSENDETWSLLGMLHELTGTLDQAEIAYRRALHINPDRVMNYLGLAELVRKQGNLEQFGELLHLARGHLENEPFYCQAKLEAIDGNSELALKLLQKALQQRPSVRYWACRDPGLANLHGLPEFRRAVQSDYSGHENAA